MKQSGLLGGVSRQSSAEYDEVLNEQVQRRAGGLHSTHAHVSVLLELALRLAQRV